MTSRAARARVLMGASRTGHRVGVATVHSQTNTRANAAPGGRQQGTGGSIWAGEGASEGKGRGVYGGGRGREGRGGEAAPCHIERQPPAAYHLLELRDP